MRQYLLLSALADLLRASLEYSKNYLTNSLLCSIISELRINAAIAQSVERILGKDEVASSNLASSSNKKAHPDGWAFLLEKQTDLNNPMQMSGGHLLEPGWTGSTLYFSPAREKKQQIWLAVGDSTICKKILDKL